MNEGVETNLQQVNTVTAGICLCSESSDGAIRRTAGFRAWEKRGESQFIYTHSNTARIGARTFELYRAKLFRLLSALLHVSNDLQLIG